MDFIVFSAILNAVILYLILSYNIACQYAVNFWTRLQALSAWLHPVIKRANVWFKVPNFHLPPHLPFCHSPFSFHFMWGAGRTHGETVEQNWEFSNGAAASTKMMGLGVRQATLEDLFGFHNWRRQVAGRRLLAKRMAENVKEGQVHRDAFEAFDVALMEAAPALVTEWRELVHDWESVQHKAGAKSPFELKEAGKSGVMRRYAASDCVLTAASMKDIRAKLVKAEILESGEGTEIEREDTPSTFNVMGLEIEESQ
jgi:hypothetical protein